MVKKKNKMKKIDISILAIMFVLVCSVFAVQAQTKNKKDKLNVLDYYKLLPANANLLSPNILDDEYTKIAVKDTKNGYLKIEGAFEGWIEVALFRKKNGSAILLVGENSCGPACGTELNAYKMVNGKMENVTNKMIPTISEDELREKFRRDRNDSNAEMISYIFELPRYGTTIKINDDDTGYLIYEIKWENDKFVIIR